MARLLGLSLCLGMLTGCVADNPQLAMLRVDGRLEIWLPTCAVGGEAMDIRMTDNAPSEEETPLITLWEVHRSRALGRTRIPIGELLPGDVVRSPLGSLELHPFISVGVYVKDKNQWDGGFDLRKVGAQLNGGDDLGEITQNRLDEIGDCGPMA